MAWKRGIKNNQEGAIQKGHIREFLLPSSRSSSVSAGLKVVNAHDPYFSGTTIGNEEVYAYISEIDHGFPDEFLPFVQNGMVYLHAHEHARSVLSVVLHPHVEKGSIVLNETQLVNSKVCTGEIHKWTVYQGQNYTYDAREGVIGDTTIRCKGHSVPSLSTVLMHVRRKEGVSADASTSDSVTLDVANISCLLQKKLFMSILTVDDVIVSSDGNSEIPLVFRVAEIHYEIDAESEDGVIDEYRGLFDAGTKVYVVAENQWQRLDLVNAEQWPSQRPLRDEISILTSDDEEFPVIRKLLRPCISLTSVVQAGYGKYKAAKTDDGLEVNSGEASGLSNHVVVNVDACTFDRVLLYLEHVARDEVFRFDPLIANDLLAAADTLGILNLSDICQKVLGSFQDRVRRTPIRYDEIIARNHAGDESFRNSGKRSDTWLILDGMVLDVSRWLDEHPGGSTIIPEQALNKDCTLFFEIYHASRQSFLYLKEFYIGEICDEDRCRVLKDGEVSSQAFMEELRRHTSWRLKKEDMLTKEVHKSF